MTAIDRTIQITGSKAALRRLARRFGVAVEQVTAYGAEYSCVRIPAGADSALLDGHVLPDGRISARELYDAVDSRGEPCRTDRCVFLDEQQLVQRVGGWTPEEGERRACLNSQERTLRQRREIEADRRIRFV